MRGRRIQTLPRGRWALWAALLMTLIVCSADSHARAPDPSRRAGGVEGSYEVPSRCEVTSFAGGNGHSAAVKSDGTVWFWGRENRFPPHGGGSGRGHLVPMPNPTPPTQVSGLTEITAVAAGNLYTVALKADGTVWAWGYNPNGRLGDGTTIDRATPVQVKGLTGVTAVAASYEDTVAIVADRSVWAWGGNKYRQLGFDTGAYRTTPVQVSGNLCRDR